MTIMGTSCMWGYSRCSGLVEGVDALLAWAGGYTIRDPGRMM